VQLLRAKLRGGISNLQPPLPDAVLAALNAEREADAYHAVLQHLQAVRARRAARADAAAAAPRVAQRAWGAAARGLVTLCAVRVCRPAPPSSSHTSLLTPHSSLLTPLVVSRAPPPHETPHSSTQARESTLNNTKKAEAAAYVMRFFEEQSRADRCCALCKRGFSSDEEMREWLRSDLRVCVCVCHVCHVCLSCVSCVAGCVMCVMWSCVPFVSCVAGCVSQLSRTQTRV
jgi:hypothetical protein